MSIIDEDWMYHDELMAVVRYHPSGGCDELLHEVNYTAARLAAFVPQMASMLLENEFGADFNYENPSGREVCTWCEGHREYGGHKPGCCYGKLCDRIRKIIKDAV